MGLHALCKTLSPFFEALLISIFLGVERLALCATRVTHRKNLRPTHVMGFPTLTLDGKPLVEGELKNLADCIIVEGAEKLAAVLVASFCKIRLNEAVAGCFVVG